MRSRKLLADLLSASEGQNADNLLDRVLARDLRFGIDELESLAEILKTAKDSLEAESIRVGSAEVKHTLQEQLDKLTRILDRITEASAMA